MTDYGFNEDIMVNKFLELMTTDYLSKADKERLEQFMDTYATAKNDFIRQLNVMNEIKVTKMLEGNAA